MSHLINNDVVYKMITFFGIFFVPATAKPLHDLDLPTFTPSILRTVSRVPCRTKETH